MAMTRLAVWYFSRLSLGVATGLVAGLALLLFLPSAGMSQAAAISADSAAGYQTTEKLILTVTVPPHKSGTSKLEVMLLDVDGKEIAGHERSLPVTETKTGQRFEFAAPNMKADNLLLRCKLDKDEFTVPLKKVLLVKAHETALTGWPGILQQRHRPRCAARSMVSGA